MNKILWSKKTDNWSSPSWILEKFQNYFDPCPLNSKTDGLAIRWKKLNYVNPPYSQIRAWVEKAISEAEIGGGTTIMLLPARTDTRWFHDLIIGKYEVLFLKGRLKFGGQKNSAPFPSMFVRICPLMPKNP